MCALGLLLQRLVLHLRTVVLLAIDYASGMRVLVLFIAHYAVMCSIKQSCVCLVVFQSHLQIARRIEHCPRFSAVLSLLRLATGPCSPIRWRSCIVPE